MAASSSSRRRDNSDPVRSYADGRVAYWSGGRAGVGQRLWERTGSAEAGHARATELREMLASGVTGAVPKGEATLDDLAQDCIESLRALRAPEGTVRQYRSDWNRWVPEHIGSVPCRQAQLWHWNQILDGIVAGGGSAGRIAAVVRTVRAVTNWGAGRGYFGSEEPWGSPTRRAQAVRAAKQRAKKLAGEAGRSDQVTLEDCPTWTDILTLAEALEDAWPDYGRNAVLLAAGTGVRGGELFGLKVEDFDLATGVVRVERQLDRYADWPATQPPKGGKKRQTVLWGHLVPVAEAAIANAHTDGWLFPRPDEVKAKKWLTKINKIIDGVIADSEWGWTLHWTRHLYCSLSIAPVAAGGYGLEPASVARWTGHGDLATLLNKYVQPQRDSIVRAHAVTSVPPGH